MRLSRCYVPLGRVVAAVRPHQIMSTRHDLTRKRLMPDSRIAELEHDLDTAAHPLHEIVIAAFRREHGRDPASR